MLLLLLINIKIGLWERNLDLWFHYLSTPWFCNPLPSFFTWLAPAEHHALYPSEHHALYFHNSHQSL